MERSILIIEDDKDLQEVLRETLLDHGYSVWLASDGTQAINLVQKYEPNLILLDLGLPTMSGESVLSEVKKNYPEIPIIILTGKSDVNDMISGLNLGADDYVTKPFDIEVLLARIKARFRSMQSGQSKLVVDDLVLDPKTKEVYRAKKNITLTPQEFKILEFLMNNKGRVLSREMILSRLWKSNPDIETRVVDVYIGYLRKKIDTDTKKKIIRSVRGFGYKVAE